MNIIIETDWLYVNEILWNEGLQASKLENYQIKNYDSLLLVSDVYRTLPNILIHLLYLMVT